MGKESMVHIQNGILYDHKENISDENFRQMNGTGKIYILS